MVFSQAAEHTACFFAESWFSLFASSADSIDFRAQSEHKPCQQTWSVSVIHALPADTTSQVSFSASNITDFDSSLLSPYLEQCSFTENEFPTTQPATLHHTSSEYHSKLVETMELDTHKYAHVPEEIMSALKDLVRQYPQAFFLPNSPLSTIKGFYHNINTGDSPPVYRLPYRKSPAELSAIKEELERMIKLNIIQPSHSA